MADRKDQAKRAGPGHDGAGRGPLAGAPQRPLSTDGERSGEGRAGPAAEAAAQSQEEAALLAELRSENAALKDRLLRALAETENVRRRADRDLEAMRQYAIAKFAGDLLPVADNMARALASIPPEARRDAGPVKALVEGIELTEKELLHVLAQHGVTRLSPAGKRFDPHFHEALFEVPDATVPDGTVSQVVEPGYSIGTRALRPAKVGIARGGPSAKPPPDR